MLLINVEITVTNAESVLDVGWVERSATQHIQDVELRKSSNATCYNAGNHKGVVAPQPTIFLQQTF
ncbi:MULTISPECIES: hypothetical protein [unclassified Nostoc]|uniref:hypothetical protein n=1 Tax=unclassified Nostoc TaxID=2593658 RepID=UPI002AD5523C|nr:hypothetical protein [Nostoc sp. DedQUE03]MDZ7972985.1 hypothetical protein [Nostoc sp. DedQUE03]